MTWLDDRVSDWHHSYGNVSLTLPGYLGMSEALYQRFIHHDPTHVLGIDEVGFGAWAGPLVVGGVLSPLEWNHPEVKDSKQFSGKNKEQKRVRVLAKLQKEAPHAKYVLHRTSWEDVDRLGLGRALLAAFESIIRLVGMEETTLVVIDGDKHVPGIDHVALPKADTFVPQVSAASILAKVSRDTEMIELAKKYPQYRFQDNKGYPSQAHRIALRKYGVCPVHRKSYRPIQQLELRHTS